MSIRIPQLATFFSPQINEYIITTVWDKEVGFIIYEPPSVTDLLPAELLDDPRGHRVQNVEELPLIKAPFVPSFMVRFFPASIKKVKLQWTELVYDIPAAEKLRCKQDPSRSKYSSIRSFEGSNVGVGVRQEMVNLRKDEPHPMVAEVTTSDGADMEIVVMVHYIVLNPLKVLRLDDRFLAYAGSLIEEAVRAWSIKKPYDEVRAVSSVNTPLKGELSDVIADLNYEKFLPFGFYVKGFSIPLVALAKNSLQYQKNLSKLVESKNDVLIAEQELKATEHRAKAQEKQNEAELKFRREDAEIKLKLITGSADALAKVNGSWKVDRLYLGGGSSNFGQTLVESGLQVQDFAEGDSDKRRLKKEKSNSKTKEGGTDEKQ